MDRSVPAEDEVDHGAGEVDEWLYSGAHTKWQTLKSYMISTHTFEVMGITTFLYAITTFLYAITTVYGSTDRCCGCGEAGMPGPPVLG